MARSAFLKNGSSQRFADITYNLRGLNMVTPDQSVDDSDRTVGQSPYTINSRMYAPENEPRTAISSRRGAGFYTIPVGESQDVSQEAVTGASTVQMSNLKRYAQPFSPTGTRRLSRLDLRIRSNTSNDVIVVEIRQDVSGNFGPRIAISTAQRQSVTDTYAYATVRFPQAPLMDNTKDYWIMVYAQDDTVGEYDLSTTTAATGLLASIDGGVVWTPTSTSLNFKTYQANDAPVLGQWRYVKSDGTKQTLFAVGGASPAIYKVDNESTGAVSTIVTGLDTDARRYRSEVVAGILYIVNGYDPVIKWNGSTVTRLTHSTAFPVPQNIILHKNRVFYYDRDNPTRVYFSELAPDYDTINSVNFVYVPDPTSPDPITGWTIYQDQLVIFKNDSKWQLIGSDISSFSLTQSPGGTKGAVCQEAIARGETLVFFWSSDGGPYYYDGARDVAIGDIILPETKNITDLQFMDSVVTDREWRIYYRTAGEINHKRMLLYDLRYAEWFLDTETYTRLPDVRTLESNELVEASSVLGALYYGEAEDANLGAPIDWKYWTNYKKYTSGIARDRVRTFRAVFESPNRSYSVLVGKDADFNNDPAMRSVLLQTSGILYDGGETYGSPTAIYDLGTKVASPKVSLSGRANNTQYRFEKFGAHTRVFLYGYEGIIKSGRPR